VSLAFTITVPDALRVAEDFEEVGDRAGDLSEPYREAATYLEELHATGFRRLHGRYVRTGATRSSLTGGPGGIRNVDPTGLLFGSGVWYSKFLTKRRQDPEMGQVDKKPPLEGRHAVLFFPTEAQNRVSEMLMGYLTEPFGD
jgi:hypothetical protein